MCGIAGLVDMHGISEPMLIKKMTDRLKHRGPDDEGFLAYNLQTREPVRLSGPDSKIRATRIEDYKGPAHVLLGHRRLSIIDLSASGHQPMSTEDGKIWIVYNGEVYNYIEIKKELEEIGYNFTTETDTEVVLKSYLAYGYNCVEKFNGMWAFAILDTKRNILFLSRDLPGVKPLYYIYVEGKYFVFASEAKAFFDLLKYTDLTINEGKVFEYLAFGIVDRDERTFFNGIFELPPGHNAVLELANLKLKLWPHRRIEINTRYEKPNPEKLKEYAYGIRERIFRAVELRLRSDVSVGSCLSGGIDSSTIVMTINEILKNKSIKQIGNKQKVFTASFEGTPEDETRWAELIVKKANVEWYRVTPTFETLTEDLEDIVYYQDFPFPTTSMYAHYCVMRLVRQSGVTVTLDGQGADEIFSGYYFHFGPYYAEMLRKLDFYSILREVRYKKNMPLTFTQLGKYVSISALGKLLPRPLLKLLLRLGKSLKLLNKEFVERNKDTLNEMVEWYIERYSAAQSLNTILYDSYVRDTLKPILRFADRNSMRFSVEARVPFADDLELVEYAFSIPSSYKINQGYAKYILRVATKGLIPEETRWRRDKKGFVTPEKSWFEKDKLALLQKLCVHTVLSEFGVTNESQLFKEIADATPSGLWRIVNFSVWLNKANRIVKTT